MVDFQQMTETYADTIKRLREQHCDDQKRISELSQERDHLYELYAAARKDLDECQRELADSKSVCQVIKDELHKALNKIDKLHTALIRRPVKDMGGAPWL